MIIANNCCKDSIEQPAAGQDGTEGDLLVNATSFCKTTSIDMTDKKTYRIAKCFAEIRINNENVCT